MREPPEGYAKTIPGATRVPVVIELRDVGVREGSTPAAHSSNLRGAPMQSSDGEFRAVIVISAKAEAQTAADLDSGL